MPSETQPDESAGAPLEDGKVLRRVVHKLRFRKVGDLPVEQPHLRKNLVYERALRIEAATELSDTTTAIAPVTNDTDAAAMCLVPSPRG